MKSVHKRKLCEGSCNPSYCNSRNPEKPEAPSLTWPGCPPRFQVHSGNQPLSDPVAKVPNCQTQGSWSLVPLATSLTMETTAPSLPSLQAPSPQTFPIQHLVLGAVQELRKASRRPFLRLRTLRHSQEERQRELTFFVSTVCLAWFCGVYICGLIQVESQTLILFYVSGN